MSGFWLGITIGGALISVGCAMLLYAGGGWRWSSLLPGERKPAKAAAIPARTEAPDSYARVFADMRNALAGMGVLLVEVRVSDRVVIERYATERITERPMTLIMGVPIVVDPAVPADTARLVYNDGTHKDLPVPPGQPPINPPYNGRVPRQWR